MDGQSGICRGSLPKSVLLLTAALAAGCTAVGDHVPGAPEHHRQHGFANPSGAIGTDPLEFLYDRTRLAVAGAEDSSAPALSSQDAAEAWAESGASDAVQWLGHATVRLRLAGEVLLVDPVFADYVTPLPPFGPPRATPPPLLPADLTDIGAIIVSHDHYDHFEPASINAIAAGSGASCFLPLLIAEDEGLKCSLVELDWGDTAELGPVRASLQPAQHESGRGLFDRDQSLWGAWLIEGGGKRVYISGDGGYGPHLAALGEASGGLDLAILSVGGYEPRRYNQALHMNPEEAVRAFQDLRARRALIVNWGTYPLGTENVRESLEALRSAAAEAGLAPDALIFLAIGETILF